MLVSAKHGIEGTERVSGLGLLFWRIRDYVFGALCDARYCFFVGVVDAHAVLVFWFGILGGKFVGWGLLYVKKKL